MSISKYIFISKLVNAIIIVHLFFQFIGAYILQYYFSEYSPILYEKLSYFIKSLNAVGEFSDYSLSRLIQFSLVAIFILCAPIIMLYEYFVSYKICFLDADHTAVKGISLIFCIIFCFCVYLIGIDIFFFLGESLSGNMGTKGRSYVFFGDCFICIIFQSFYVLVELILIFYVYIFIGLLFKKILKYNTG
ncbi:hypothetical protein QV01_07315 [Gallibacterium genomosp. 3]|uniref:Uncharacterized protein n=1 Tax=Gallibacterium genomosp. 3 TaxID=505345 RepID=A0A1A7NPE6_9PAST|nr:hypothetical protein [Gallibacterium genomosp. 3]OBW91498.1 hypothetical protein QV01_07315 [Gallibacterium genomosp. 3]